MPTSFTANPINVTASPTNQAVSGPNYEQLFRGIIERLSGGGEFLKSTLADIKTGKRRGIASSMQNLVSSGLSGTTIRAGIPIAAEEVAGRARLAARGDAESRLTSATSQFAHLGEAARQAELERRAGMERTAMLSQSQEAMQMRGIQTAGGGYTPTSQAMGGMTGSRTPIPSSSGSMGGIGGIGGQSVPDWMGGGSTGYPGGQSAADVRAGIQMGDPIYGDPNVRDAQGNIIGTRQTNITPEIQAMVEGQTTSGGQTRPDLDTAYSSWLKEYLSRPGAYVTSGTKKRWASKHGYT